MCVLVALLAALPSLAFGQRQWTADDILQLDPDPASWWESQSVFARSVIHREGRLRLWYEATSAPGGNDWIGWQIGCAESVDFLEWNRLEDDPCFPCQ